MQRIQTEILVIGGGATGTGILRDLAMRGFQSILVEQRDFTHGTTGRFHGLLHSGGRYAVKDPDAARECIEENRILRKIMPFCIEDTNGYFVLTPDDDPNYIKRFVGGCRKAGIPVDEIPIHQMLEKEPYLNPEISRCFQVPDAAVDGFAAAHANIASAIEYGAQALTYHEVNRLLLAEKPHLTGSQHPQVSTPIQVVGAICHDLVHDEFVEIHADLVINAAGAWVGKIGETAGIEIAIRPGKGTMIAVSHRIVNTVINRLKLPADGDILVPAHTVAVMGTTDEQVPDPDKFAIEPWEIQHILAEGEKIIPGFSQLRMLRAWAGVRPLYQETKTDQSRDITRSFVLLDHEERDNVSGILTITSGKWTTYRKMAEATVDKACEKLGTERICQTHSEELPTNNIYHKNGGNKYHTLGQRFARVERDKTYGNLICECELATTYDIEWSITEGQAKTLDDIRRDVRLGMGPCQGGFCTLRAAGILQRVINNRESPKNITHVNVNIHDFLQERWKGLLPILWGHQLRQESLNELIYLYSLNIEHLPGSKASMLGSDNYAEAKSEPNPIVNKHPSSKIQYPSVRSHQKPIDTIVIGAGLSGLTAAWQLTSSENKVRVVAKGWGATHWDPGCIDVLGYYPIGSAISIDNPVPAIARLNMEKPDHPYAKLSLKKIDMALKSFQSLCAEAGYPLRGSIEKNWLLPTASGAFRPTCLAPETFIAGDLKATSPVLIVGFEGYNDFYPHLVAANLEIQGIPARAVVINLSGLVKLQRIDALVLSRYFDDPDTRSEIEVMLRPHIKGIERIGFPAVLGMSNAFENVKSLESMLGCRVFEIPGLPPSVPGMRLHQILLKAIQNSGGQVLQGIEVIGYHPSSLDNQVAAVLSEAASRAIAHTAHQYILATGGILGGGITTNHDGSILDPVFDLPVQAPGAMAEWFERDFLHPDGHAIFSAGIPTDQNFKTGLENVYAIGGMLCGDFIRECSLSGVALVSGHHVAEVLT